MKRILLLSIGILSLMFTLAACNSSKKLTKKKESNLTKVYESLKRDMSEAIVTKDDNGVKVVLPEAVLFKVNKSDINPEYFPIMKRMADVLNKYPDVHILISGFTDTTGSKEHNLDLSKRRAESAKAVLEQSNVSNNQMYTWGKGWDNPIADNKSEAGRAQNRRVEFVIMYDYKP